MRDKGKVMAGGRTRLVREERGERGRGNKEETRTGGGAMGKDGRREYEEGSKEATPEANIRPDCFGREQIKGEEDVRVRTNSRERGRQRNEERKREE